jgi:2-methylisocitrate lyase-like PEP mutase family enzyme
MSLRTRLAEQEILLALGAHDGLTARIAEASGIEAIYHGGYATAAHHFGLPDIGLVGLAEVTESVRRVRSATSLPIIVDADTGYGNEPNVRRTIEELERAGADAVQIEDQVSPKRCGHMTGKQVIPRDEMVLKVRAAVGARRNPETVIVARTDALQVAGLDDAIARVNAYAEAGADVVFVDAPQTVEQIAEIAQRTSTLLLANASETGRSPSLPAAEYERLGYAVVIFPSTQTWLFAKTYRELCEAVLRDGTSLGLRERMLSFDEVNELLRLNEWQKEET